MPKVPTRDGIGRGDPGLVLEPRALRLLGTAEVEGCLDESGSAEREKLVHVRHGDKLAAAKLPRLVDRPDDELSRRVVRQDREAVLDELVENWPIASRSEPIPSSDPGRERPEREERPYERNLGRADGLDRRERRVRPGEDPDRVPLAGVEGREQVVERQSGASNRPNQRERSGSIGSSFSSFAFSSSSVALSRSCPFPVGMNGQNAPRL